MKTPDRMKVSSNDSEAGATLQAAAVGFGRQP
ncbi:hypothetical protein SAMN05443572_113163 [Myxococcus fulvus]|uniref:Uncharacterized protein n=1 Tax=Myxococcus fulvus TaxID=33 RepID=A0ABY1CUH6_MYXFU|nr:hypothetical protein MFUL124B02_10565 [Myxococcus fulvus 124B02]SEU38688.1 hypothetical protein SAMN05443572_113163 [Myxococcus fulvus]